jgi:hypothetical protein
MNRKPVQGNLVSGHHDPGWLGKGTGFQAAILIATMVVMSNLNALVDAVLHPEIPYFDHEHLIVGATTAVVSGLLVGALIVHLRRLNEALATIRTLEGFLPICAHCKRIQKADGDPGKMESWQPVELYVAERMDTKFTHGICPECLIKYFSKPEGLTGRQ